jgi:predicted small lipoprotein YifL
MNHQLGARVAVGVAFGFTIAACGARTPLGQPDEAGVSPVELDAAVASIDAGDESPGIACTTPVLTIGAAAGVCEPNETCCQYRVTRTCGGDSYVWSGTCLGDVRNDLCLVNGAFKGSEGLNEACSCDAADILALAHMYCLF